MEEILSYFPQNVPVFLSWAVRIPVSFYLLTQIPAVIKYEKYNDIGFLYIIKSLLKTGLLSFLVWLVIPETLEVVFVVSGTAVIMCFFAVPFIIVCTGGSVARAYRNVLGYLSLFISLSGIFPIEIAVKLSYSTLLLILPMVIGVAIFGFIGGLSSGSF